MKQFLPVILAVFLPGQQLFAQVIKIADVLATAETETRIQQNQSLLNTAQGLKMHDPLLREVGVRLGTNGSAQGDTIYGYLRNEDTYQLQVGFNSLRERRRQRQIKTARVGVISAEGRLLRQEALVERYEALAGYLFVEPRRAACRRLDSLLEKEHLILREMLTSGVLDVKVTKVLDVEEDLNRNRLSLQELDNALRLHKNRLQQYTGNFSDIDRSDLVTLTDIRANVAALKMAPSANNPLFDAKDADVELEKANLSYISSQNRQVFNNFAIGYQRPLYLERPKRFNTLNNFYIRATFNLPLPANNRYKKADAMLDLQEARNEAGWTREETLGDLEQQFVRLDNLFREYDVARERLDNSLIRKMLDNPTLRTQITPLEIIELEIAQQKLRVSQAGLLSDIAAEYVRLLELSGAAADGSGRNYLGAGR
jgi:hypothetical protein